MGELTKIAVQAPIVTYRWSTRYDQFYREAKALIAEHWAEVGAHRDILDLNPDHTLYRSLESVGALHILLARHDGRLVGYHVVFTKRHPRDVSVLIGMQDAIYCAPAYRASGVGWSLISAGLKKFEELGVNIVFLREKIREQGGGHLKKLGFEQIETCWAKVIKAPERKAT